MNVRIRTVPSGASNRSPSISVIMFLEPGSILAVRCKSGAYEAMLVLLGGGTLNNAGM